MIIWEATKIFLMKKSISIIFLNSSSHQTDFHTLKSIILLIIDEKKIIKKIIPGPCFKSMKNLGKKQLRKKEKKEKQKEERKKEIEKL